MARAHRMGQARDVLIYRLVTRASVEERMISCAKKKMVLERLVVQKTAAGGGDDDAAGGAGGSKRTAGGLRQSELDDILRYGATELFAEDGDGEAAAAAAAQLTWDDAAIERLLDRTAAEARDAAEDEPEDDLLAAFKVAHFEPTAAAPQAADAAGPATASASAAAVAASEDEAAPAAGFWDSLLGERYEDDEARATAAMGKGKRTRKVVSYAQAGGEADSSGDEFGGSSDSEAGSDGEPGGGSGRERGLRPLLDSSGAVHGFSARDRATFLKVVMRFGLGDLSWRQHAAALRDKSADSVREYATLFAAHLAEPHSEAETFSDGVPKDGMRLHEVLTRIVTLTLLQRKAADCTLDGAMRFNAHAPGAPRPPPASRAWGPAQDYALVAAVLRHGYGSWRECVLDERAALQGPLRQELGQPPEGQPRPVPPSMSAAQTTLPSLLHAVEAASGEGGGGAEPPVSDAEAVAAHEAAAAAAAAAWQASLVHGLTPAELTMQTSAFCVLAPASAGAAMLSPVRLPPPSHPAQTC